MPFTDMTFQKDMGYTSFECTLSDYGVKVVDHSIGYPQIKQQNVEIPGRNGMIDLNETLFGAPVYGMREITADCLLYAPCEEWETILSNIASTIHGGSATLEVSEDPDWRYTGVFHMEPHTTYAKGIASFRIVGECEPFKTAAEETTTTVNSTGRNIKVNDGEIMTVRCGASTTGTMVFNSTDEFRVTGPTDFYGLVLREGINTARFTPSSGSGSITLYLRRGKL